MINVLEYRTGYARWRSECDACHSVTVNESRNVVLVSYIEHVVRCGASSQFTCRPCYDEEIKKIDIYGLY